MVGDHVFTQNTPGTLERAPRHPAGAMSENEISIGMGSYNFDSHNVQRYACRSAAHCRGHSGRPAKDIAGASAPFVQNEGNVQASPGRPYAIPYWVALPKKHEAENLLVIGALSASHIGMSTLRMEPQLMIIGHSIGVAAGLAQRTAGGAVHEINTTVLQEKLVADGQILHAGATESQATVRLTAL
eukprot:gene3353-biopygen3302